MIKIKNSDFRGGLDGAYLKGLKLTDLNISRFDLYKMPKKSTDMVSVYKLSKNYHGVYIIHDLVNKKVDWCEKLV